MNSACWNLAWILVFVAGFWIDDWFFDPAALKLLFLPPALALVLVLAWGRFSASRWLLWGMLPFGWALGRTGDMANSASVQLAIGAGFLAFLVGKSGARPPAWIAFLALSAAIGRGWADLLLGHNWGGGIPCTATSFFVHKNLFGMVLGPALLLVLHWLIDHGWTSRLRVWALGLLVAGGWLFLLAQSRGAQMGFLAGGCVLLGWRWGRLRSIGVRMGLVSTLLVLAIGFAVFAKERIFQAYQEAAALVRGEVVRTNVPTRFRPWVWQGAIALWKDSPLIGCGMGNFEYEIESRVQPWGDSWRERGVRIGVAHSHWLHVLVEKGLVGFALEVGIFLAACVAAFLHRQHGLLAALLAMGVHGFVAEGLQYAAGSVFWWWSIGFALHRTSGFPMPSWGRWLLGGVLLVPLGLRVSELRGELAYQKALEAPPEQRQALLLRSVDFYPKNPTILMELSRFQAAQGDRDGATNTLFHLRALYPSPNAVFMERPLAGALLLAGRSEEAVSVLTESLRLYPYDPLLAATWLDAVEARWGCDVRMRARDSLRPAMDRILNVQPKETTDENLVRQRDARLFRQAARDWGQIRDRGCKSP